MIDIHRFVEIAEVNHRILNPLADTKVDLLGELLHLGAGIRIIDLGSGKGEMLCRFAARYGTAGTGVDIHPPCVEAARVRAVELGVAERVRFVVGDGAEHVDEHDSYDVGMAIGTSWIGGGLLGTIDLLRRWTTAPGLLALGEVFWAEPPPAELQAMHDPRNEFLDLVGILDRINNHGFDLVEMIVANTDDWDRYEASMWANVARWLDDNPNDPAADDVRQTWRRNQRAYLLGGRRCLGWAVFIVRQMM